MVPALIHFIQIYVLFDFCVVCEVFFFNVPPNIMHLEIVPKPLVTLIQLASEMGSQTQISSDFFCACTCFLSIVTFYCGLTFSLLNYCVLFSLLVYCCMLTKNVLSCQCALSVNLHILIMLLIEIVTWGFLVLTIYPLFYMIISGKEMFFSLHRIRKSTCQFQFMAQKS